MFCEDKQLIYTAVQCFKAARRYSSNSVNVTTPCTLSFYFIISILVIVIIILRSTCCTTVKLAIHITTYTYIYTLVKKRAKLHVTCHHCCRMIFLRNTTTAVK